MKLKDERIKKPAYKDWRNYGNSPKFRTGKKCIEDGCEESAGTWWSPYWCIKHNIERIDRITKGFESFLHRRKTIKADRQKAKPKEEMC